ncbi:MAG: FAD:protein FMN transferase [Bacteroidota bacterium]
MKDLLKYNCYFLILVALVTFSSGCSTNSSKKLKTAQGKAFGTTYTIKYEAIKSLTEIAAEMERIFDTVNISMSTYLSDSDISKINKGDTTVRTDIHFKTVFLKAKEVWKNSQGKFDPTVGALVNAWGFGPENTLNDIAQQHIDSILHFTGFDKISLSANGSITKAHQAVYLDFNALAKGYAIDRIGHLFDEKGIENYLIELGGEVLAKGINTQTGKNWRIAVDSPLQQENERTLIARLSLTDRAIATSGNYRKFRIDPVTGLRYAHIINPKTGYPQKSNILSVSVLAATCMEADAYATAFMVMELEEIKALLQRLNTIEAYVIYTDKENQAISYATRGFENLMVN